MRLSYKGGSPMKMFMVSSKWMCNKHLLDEHRDLHAIIGALHKGGPIGVHIEVSSIYERHNALVNELTIRGYKHKTPIVQSEIVFEHLPISVQEFKIDRDASATDLFVQCRDCSKRCEIYNTINIDFTDAFYCDNSIIFRNQQGVCGLMQTEIREAACYICEHWDWEGYQFGPGEYEVDGKNKGFCTVNNRNKPTNWCQSCDIGQYKHKPYIKED